MEKMIESLFNELKSLIPTEHLVALGVLILISIYLYRFWKDEIPVIHWRRTSMAKEAIKILEHEGDLNKEMLSILRTEVSDSVSERVLGYNPDKMVTKEMIRILSSDNNQIELRWVKQSFSELSMSNGKILTELDRRSRIVNAGYVVIKWLAVASVIFGLVLLLLLFVVMILTKSFVDVLYFLTMLDFLTILGYGGVSFFYLKRTINKENLQKALKEFYANKLENK